MVSGHCDLSSIPAGLQLDLDEAQASALIAFVRQWLDGTTAPPIAWHTGIAFAKSEDDTGADPPYPTEKSAQSVLACGLSQRWLQSHLAAELAERARTDEGIACWKNVCCWPPRMEFDSSGAVVFARPAEPSGPWVVRAATKVADNGALTEETTAVNRAAVRRELENLLPQVCRGEPERPFGQPEP